MYSNLIIYLNYCVDITRFDENDSSNTDNDEVTKSRKCNQYLNCPADPNCREKITGKNKMI